MGIFPLPNVDVDVCKEKLGSVHKKFFLRFLSRALSILIHTEHAFTNTRVPYVFLIWTRCID